MILEVDERIVKYERRFNVKNSIIRNKLMTISRVEPEVINTNEGM